MKGNKLSLKTKKRREIEGNQLNRFKKQINKAKIGLTYGNTNKRKRNTQLSLLRMKQRLTLDHTNTDKTGN